tara:strand:+ start:295 stop:732 length:438 start_codon:yes stop_codon:yes gene_type:complete
MGRKMKKRIDPGLELARSDTERIRKLSNRAEQTRKEMHRASADFNRKSETEGWKKRVADLVEQGSHQEAMRVLKRAYKLFGEDFNEAIVEAKQAKGDLKAAPFEMLKLLEAAERKHGKPFRKRKGGRGALLTKEAASRLLKARRK